jgi:transposase
MFACVLDQTGEIRAHKNLKVGPEPFLRFIKPFRPDVVVGVECMFTWYWLGDLCAEQGIDFVLGHALYMKAIHGGKAKNDRIDSRKIATLLRGGAFPMAYVYPAGMRSTRDLLRRRNHLMRKRSELLRHIINTDSQHNLPSHGRSLLNPGNRVCSLEKYKDPAVNLAVAADLEIIKFYDHVLPHLERYILQSARRQDHRSLALLRTIPGVGKILGMTVLYEIHDIRRFPRVQEFASYARLVKPAKMSAGKKRGFGGRKIGNAHLKWAFSEAVTCLMGQEPRAKRLVDRKAAKYGKGKAMSILAHKLGRAVYFMLKRKEAFDTERFFSNG